MKAQTLTVSGFRGSTTASVSGNDTAASIATAINNITSTTGVEATATTKVKLSSISVAGTISFTLGGDATKAIEATITSVNDLTALRDEINSVSGTTGVTATGTGSSLILEHSGGKDITLLDYGNTGGVSATMVADALNASDSKNGNQGNTVTESANDSFRASGYVSLTSNKAFSVSSSVNAANDAGSITNNAANVAETSSDALLSAVDIGTVTGAQSAIDIVDGALATISNQRADLGALQSRFESVVSSLTASSENQTAARSRILDADFAAETARLTRGQILQQAGIAVLAQANAAPQNVLALLQ